MTEMTFTNQMDVSLVGQSGGDEAVLAAMLVSTQAEDSLKLLEDPIAAEGRIRFLMRNRHGTPFEHNQFRFFVSAPIFVFREFQRHRIGWSYNEESGRYKQLAPKFYVPGPERPLVQVGKPGAYEMVPGDPMMHEVIVEQLRESYTAAYETYTFLLQRGIAKEIARACLPVATYSSMYATCNARSLMSFLALRTDVSTAAFPSKPLYEIDDVATQMEIEFSRAMPITYDAWNANGRVAP